MKGISAFVNDPFRQSLDQIKKEIDDSIVEIKEWQTLMNIFVMKGWKDPITDEVKILLCPKKLLTADDISDAVSILPSNKDKAIDFLISAFGTSENDTAKFISVVKEAKMIIDGGSEWKMKNLMEKVNDR